MANRAIIPIRYPMTLHHVIALENHCFEAGVIPSKYMLNVADDGDDVITSVDVGFVSGINANNPRYQPLAHATWNASTRISGAIDTIYGPTDPAIPGAMLKKQYLHPVPLVGVLADAGSGWVKHSGKPIYIGKSNRNTVTRSQIADDVIPFGAYGASATAGEETAIEIRWSIKDVNAAGWGRHIDGVVPNGIVGVGGHVVYLICKKHLVSCE
jgi:hypothetical protein